MTASCTRSKLADPGYGFAIGPDLGGYFINRPGSIVADNELYRYNLATNQVDFVTVLPGLGGTFALVFLSEPSTGVMAQWSAPVSGN